MLAAVVDLVIDRLQTIPKQSPMGNKEEAGFYVNHRISSLAFPTLLIASHTLYIYGPLSQHLCHTDILMSCFHQKKLKENL